ncbi:hypothetical protein L7F22_030402 [Adiantum nelumboides]|nr:hypothetical protein [Adiantum nelumboides]
MEAKSCFVWAVMGMITCCVTVDGELQAGFYNTSCPYLEDIVYDGMQQAIGRDARMAASILRLFFHDCLVQGCDASVLLDDTPSFQGEKNAGPNANSLRGFEVIDEIKSNVEDACPGTVSCADILALAARDGVSLSGGPRWEVGGGRRDARSGSLEEANRVIPGPFLQVDKLLPRFQALGFTTQDVVTLSGAHTFGQARCLFVHNRLYNMTGDGKPDTTLNKYYLRVLQGQCPDQSGGGGENTLVMLDPYSPNDFDNRYYFNLMYGRGLFSSDQTLYSTTSSPTVQLVRAYAQNSRLFFSDFSSVMVKLANLHPLTGSQGEIRHNCHFIN